MIRITALEEVDADTFDPVNREPGFSLWEDISQERLWKKVEDGGPIVLQIDGLKYEELFDFMRFLLADGTNPEKFIPTEGADELWRVLLVYDHD